MCDCGIPLPPTGDDSIKTNSSKFDDLFYSTFYSSILSVFHRVIFLFVEQKFPHWVRTIPATDKNAKEL